MRKLGGNLRGVEFIQGNLDTAIDTHLQGSYGNLLIWLIASSPLKPLVAPGLNLGREYVEARLEEQNSDLK